MRTVSVTNNVFMFTANDRRTELFENLWPIENGVAYNSYLVIDEKIALIDTVDRSNLDDFVESINKVLNGRKIDYLVVNHMEPDHSSGIREIVRNNPGIKIVGNKMTFALLRGFYNLTDNLVEIKDGDTLSLGSKSLKFFVTPWIHWPETMMTYVEQDQILFSADAFGSFGTLDGGIFDDEINFDFYHDEMLRYYSNIVGKYSKMVQKAIKRLETLPIKAICSTHGPVWRTQISKVVNLYNNWSSYKAEKGVVIAFGSMYGNTEKLADAIARELSENGIKNIRVFDASKAHFSYLIREVWRYQGIILGSSAYNAGMFPAMETLVTKIEHLELENRLLGTFGSSGWNKAGVKGLNQWAERMKWEVVAESAETKGAPDNTSLEQCKLMARNMAKRLHEIYG